MSATLSLRPTRVLIRPPTEQDRAAFLAAVRRSRKLHQGWVSPPSNARAFTNYVERISSGAHRGFLVIERKTKALVGVINLNNVIRGNFQNAFLGYYGFKPYTGRGLMLEGMQLVLRRAFDTLKLHRVEANIQPDNTSSIALARRSGFALEGLSRRYLKVCGRWRDHQRWAMLAEDWKRRCTDAADLRFKDQPRAAFPAGSPRRIGL